MPLDARLLALINAIGLDIKALTKPSANLGATVTGGVNSTADVVGLSLSIPAGAQVGDSYRLRAAGTVTQAAVATNFNMFYAINGARFSTNTFTMGASAVANSGWSIDAVITIRSTGSSGQAIGTSGLIFRTTAIAPASALTAVNTTAALTLTVGATLSVANAGHSLSVITASISKM